jgi:predicted Zn-dependent protease
MSECLPPFHGGQFPTVEWLFLDLNSYLSSVEQHLVYFGGLHGLADAAPTRILFFSVPNLSDFCQSSADRRNSMLVLKRLCGGSMRKTRHMVSLLFLLATLLVAQGPTKLHPGFNLFSKDQDVQLGKESAAEVRKQMTVISDPFLTSYVNRVGKRLVNSPEARDSGYPFTFEVVADPTINAFALPGGPMFINTGLLKAVDNEAQLAGVMGHEMSHVILRHGTNQASKAQLIQLPAVLGSQVAGGSMVGKLAQVGIGLGANSVLLKFSRGAESQADLMGSHLMADAGYDPVQMAKFFEKLSSEGGARGPQFFSDHPNPDNREQAIQKEVSRLPKRKYNYQTGDFQKMKRSAGQIKEPAPKQQPQTQ